MFSIKPDTKGFFKIVKQCHSFLQVIENILFFNVKTYWFIIIKVNNKCFKTSVYCLIWLTIDKYNSYKQRFYIVLKSTERLQRWRKSPPLHTILKPQVKGADSIVCHTLFILTLCGNWGDRLCYWISFIQGKTKCPLVMTGGNFASWGRCIRKLGS